MTGGQILGYNEYYSDLWLEWDHKSKAKIKVNNQEFEVDQNEGTKYFNDLDGTNMVKVGYESGINHFMTVEKDEFVVYQSNENDNLFYNSIRQGKCYYKVSGGYIEVKNSLNDYCIHRNFKLTLWKEIKDKKPKELASHTTKSHWWNKGYSKGDFIRSYHIGY